MKSTNKTMLLTAAFILFLVHEASAKLKIPIGKVQEIEVVADLPNSEQYLAKEGGKDYLDLGRMHEEFNIAWVIPAWITQDPKLVLYNKTADEYYELKDEDLNTILSENKLEKEKLLNLGFYKRYGGKGILLLVLGLILWGIFGKGKSDEDVQAKKM